MMSETDEQGVHVIHTGNGNMTPQEFADREGKTLRTVRRWLSDGEVVGAWQDPVSKNWTIPGDAYRQASDMPKDQRPRPVSYVTLPGQASAGGELVLHPELGRPLEAQMLEREPTRLEDLAEEPTFLSVADAASYLGIPQAQILAQPEVFDVMHVGVNGSPRVPKATIKKFEG